MIPFMPSDRPPVTDAELSMLYERIKTPKKLGAVIKQEDRLTDSPGVFRWGDAFYMYYISIGRDCDASGYETHLARSTDLIHWDPVGTIFQRETGDRWDSKQIAGYVAFPDLRFEGTGELQTVNGKYYMSYLGGNRDGYEPDPLYMGLAKSDDPTDTGGFVRLPDPILRPEDGDSRTHETKTLYKSFLFADTEGLTGHKYVNAYNGKAEDDRERIFLAVSNDGEHWERYGGSPVIDLVTKDPPERINGDPQILLIDGIYVMFFFRYHEGKPAFNTFAASRDLVHWNIWQGKPLIESEYPWEDEHAHKTWFIRVNGVNYHYYCACNKQGERFIALATS